MNDAQDPSALGDPLGLNSPILQEAFERLAGFYRESEAIPPVANSFKAWLEFRSPGRDRSPEAFVRDTCLALACRIAAYRFLERHPSERDLWPAASGDYFVSAGLSNFLGEDIFSWPFFRRSMGIGDDKIPMEAFRSLFSHMEGLDFSLRSPDSIPCLYGAHYGADTSQRPATTTDFASALEADPRLTGISSHCGGGAGLALCVNVAIEGRLSNGEDALDTLMAVSEQFLGMTPDPLAAAVASVAFLFALDEAVKEPHPPVLIPVYLADAEQMPRLLTAPDGERSYIIDAAGGLVLPEQVAADPLYLDWLLARFPNYLRGAVLRLRAQPEEVAVQEVLNAWYNYLTSPKARTPIPEPLAPSSADLMVEAARTLILAYIRGSGPAPLHLARNAPAPLFAARRDFDLRI